MGEGKDCLSLRLMRVQKALKAPKSNFNSFGKYSYRSCEDILEAAKPLLADEGLCLTITDSIVFVEGRHYIKADAVVRIANAESGEIISVSGWAREPSTKKGMDESQITGMTSSYARKYALNALFLIDDTKDADTDEAQGRPSQQSNQVQPQPDGPIYVAPPTYVAPPQIITPEQWEALHRLFEQVSSGKDRNEVWASLRTAIGFAPTQNMTVDSFNAAMKWLRENAV